MGTQKHPSRSDGSLSWLEFVLLVILVVIVLAIVIELFGPYIKIELVRLCLENDLPCDFLK
jgi:hypothetical protein